MEKILAFLTIMCVIIVSVWKESEAASGDAWKVSEEAPREVRILCTAGQTCSADKEGKDMRKCYYNLTQQNKEVFYEYFSDALPQNDTSKITTVPQLLHVLCSEENDDDIIVEAIDSFFQKQDNKTNEPAEQKNDYENFKKCIADPVKACTEFIRLLFTYFQAKGR